MDIKRIKELAGLKNLTESIQNFGEETVITLQKDPKVVVLFPEWAKKHIAESHKSAGLGSVFTKNVNLDVLTKGIEQLDVSNKKAVYDLKIPNAGYDLVIPKHLLYKMVHQIDGEDSFSFSGQGDTSQRPGHAVGSTEVIKMERGQEYKVPAYNLSSGLSKIKTTSEVQVVIRQVTESGHINPRVYHEENGVEEAFQNKTLFCVLSAWPGKELPPVSQWNDEYIILVPNPK